MCHKAESLSDLWHEQTAIIQKSLVSQVQGDLTGITFTFENDYRLVAIACPMNFGDFCHITTFQMFMHIKTPLISNLESSSMIN